MIENTSSRALTGNPSRVVKFVSLVRRQGAAGTLRHLRVVLLHRAHAAWDRQFRSNATRDQTAAKVELHDVSIAGPNRAAGVHYLPTPWRVLDWVHEALPVATGQWSFVDFGAGKGRVLLSAGRLPYGQVIGVEFAAELAQVARTTLASTTGLVAGSVEVIEGDATEYSLPRTPVVVFLFNPFGPPVIDDVAAAISRSYKEAPRPIIIAYLNPRHHQTFELLNDFSEVSLTGYLAAKFSILSPYRLRLYVTREAMDVQRPNWRVRRQH